MRRFYLKPEAEVVSFYSDEEITATETISEDLGTTELPEGWT